MVKCKHEFISSVSMFDESTLFYCVQCKIDIFEYIKQLEASNAIMREALGKLEKFHTTYIGTRDDGSIYERTEFIAREALRKVDGK